jgi:large subunit ribosomal protein L3
MIGLIGKKVGMTQVFDDTGKLTPVTVIKVEPNVVIAERNEEKHGYKAVVIGSVAGKEKSFTKPVRGQFPEGVAPQRVVVEFRDFEKECKVGDTLGLELLEEAKYLDVSGTSKGKGFQGVIKRWHFQGGEETHGSKFHREPGSTGQSTTPRKSFKGIKMPGHMGNEKITVLNLRIVKVDAENQVVLVHGAIPGARNGSVILRKAVKR